MSAVPAQAQVATVRVGVQSHQAFHLAPVQKVLCLTAAHAQAQVIKACQVLHHHFPFPRVHLAVKAAAAHNHAAALFKKCLQALVHLGNQLHLVHQVVALLCTQSHATRPVLVPQNLPLQVAAQVVAFQYPFPPPVHQAVKAHVFLVAVKAAHILHQALFQQAHHQAHTLHPLTAKVAVQAQKVIVKAVAVVAQAVSVRVVALLLHLSHHAHIKKVLFH